MTPNPRFLLISLLRREGDFKKIQAIQAMYRERLDDLVPAPPIDFRRLLASSSGESTASVYPVSGRLILWALGLCPLRLFLS